jgi:hypothetical protein
MRKLYFDVLKEYSKAFKRWTSGTGGDQELLKILRIGTPGTKPGLRATQL